MKDKEEKTTPDADTEVQEVDIEEGDTGEAENDTDEVPQFLESDVVGAVLAETNLPVAFKVALGKGDYADEAALQEAIDKSIAEVKRLTGSGKPQHLGESEQSEPTQVTVEEAQKRHEERVNAVLAEVGIGG